MEIGKSLGETGRGERKDWSKKGEMGVGEKMGGKENESCEMRDWREMEERR